MFPEALGQFYCGSRRWAERGVTLVDSEAPWLPLARGSRGIDKPD
jgi:hypothetical protein